MTTTTYDAEGEVTSSCDPGVSRQEVEDALRQFVGDIQQVPPAHSAVKVGGKRAYALARKGEAPELKARAVSVYRIDLLEFVSQELEIEVECGRGTYIRSLAHDLGQTLGCGAHLSGLTRTRIGPFPIEEALTMDELEARLADRTWAEHAASPDAALVSLPRVTVSEDEEGRLRHGQAIAVSGKPANDGCEARTYSDSGSFVGIVVHDANDRTWKPRKIFHEAVGVAN
jgi:tRNA pseudouridine55 synthase